MKKSVLFSVMMLFPVAMAAQDMFDSLLSGEKSWLMSSRSSSPNSSVSYTETTLLGDTVIDGIAFKREYSRPCLKDGTPTGDWSATQVYLGEAGGKTYLFSNAYGNPNTQTIMDFSMAAGDMLDIVESGYDDGKVTVTSVTDTIIDSSTDKTVRRCLHVRSIVNPEQEDVWVEGIGSLRYGITGAMLSTGAIVQLLRCTTASGTLYQADDSNPVKISSVTTAVTPTSSAVYDLQGRRVKGQPTHGIYIQQGRKHVVK